MKTSETPSISTSTSDEVETFTPKFVLNLAPKLLSRSPFEQLIENIRRPLRDESIEKFFSGKEISSKQFKVLLGFDIIYTF